MSYIMDSIFGDGTPSQDASDPVRTVGSFINAGIAVAAVGAVLNIASAGAQVVSNSLEGGVSTGGQTIAAAGPSVSFSPPTLS